MNENFMKEEPVLPLITSMALPMVISMMVNSLYNIVDSFFVAQISEEAMTALSLVFPVQNFINAVASALALVLMRLLPITLARAMPKLPTALRYTAWHFPPCTELCLWLPALPLCRSF